MKKTAKILSMIALAVLLVGCNASKRIIYDFNKEESVKALLADGQIRIKPHDRLTIVVSSQNPELAAPFNAPSSFNSLTPNPLGSSSANGLQSVQVRTVDENGDLEMPIIGKIRCKNAFVARKLETVLQIVLCSCKSIFDNVFCWIAQ